MSIQILLLIVKVRVMAAQVLGFTMPVSTITTSTISGNLTGNGGDTGGSNGPVGSGGHGGAIFNAGTAILETLTLSVNRTGTTGSVGYSRPGTTDGLGAGVYAGSGTVTFQNAIIVNNDSPVDTSDDCYGTLTSGGYNLVGSGTGCPVGGNDQTTTNALLGSLADNSGATQTHALLAGSPAINRIPDGVNGCVANTSVDQRGAVRAGGTDRGGAACDIGAYEYASDETSNAVTLLAFSAHRDALPVWFALVELSMSVITISSLK